MFSCSLETKSFNNLFEETEMSTVQMKPTLSVPIFGGEITVHGFGREHGCNFSFKGIDTSPDARETHSGIFDALASIEGRHAYLAPSPILMNAEILKEEEMWAGNRWNFSGKSLFRSSEADGIQGITVRRGYAVSAADCALVVAKHGDLIIAAHAGRNSVIDMDYMKGKPERRNESVVHSIRNAIGLTGRNFRDTRVWVGFSISPGPHFAHAINDERNPHNRKMVGEITKKYGPGCFLDDGQEGALGWLDNKELIRRQFTTLGVREENIELDSVCTYSDKDVNGEPVWYSSKRQLVNEESQKRNLMVVVKN